MFVFLVCAFGLMFAEQRRTDTELDAVLSAYLAEGIVHDTHDWIPGRGLLVVLQREAQQPGGWRWRWLYPFDKRLRFTESSLATRCSFTLSNVLPTPLRVALRLPIGVSTIVVSRSQLEQAESSSEFQTRFPNNMGYIAVSRAGFNVNKTEAIFYIDHFCGLCGGGRYVLMRKVNGIWKVQNEHGTWVS
jgi:hypothetical protein